MYVPNLYTTSANNVKIILFFNSVAFAKAPKLTDDASCSAAEGIIISPSF